eukprot:scaffold237454_cov21-Tisochrysis_lutea.AAC.1
MLSSRMPTGVVSRLVRACSALASPSQIRQALHARATIIDLRTTEEFAATPKLATAMHVQWDREKETMAEVPLDPDRPVILY